MASFLRQFLTRIINAEPLTLHTVFFPVFFIEEDYVKKTFFNS